MCDYSLMNVKSRPAQVGDKLKTHNFGTGTTGFIDAGDSDESKTAVCVLPGTELAFDEPFKTREWGAMWQPKKYSKVAIFRQINTDKSHVHHDALETPDGDTILLTGLCEGQTATVLQLPAKPETEEEAKKQERLEVVA